MKMSKLLKALLFGLSFFHMGVVEGEGGGGAGEGGEGGEGKGTGEGQGAGEGKTGEGKGEGDGKGGKKPSDEEARLLKEVMQKKEALKARDTELADVKSRLAAFDGVDPDEIKKLLGERKDAETKQLEAKGDYERLRTRMAEEHTKEVDKLKAELESLRGELGKSKGTINELSIGTLFGQSQFIAGETTLPVSKARALYADHFDLEDGKVVGYDKPKGAQGRTALVDGYGNAVSFDDAMRKIIEADPDKDHLLKSKVKPGAGSESKKADVKATQQSGPTDSVSKIGAGLASLKLL